MPKQRSGFRPLTGRALKSLMDTLSFEFPQSCVLDGFAGEGRFGLEAIRRGAEHVSFVEAHLPTAQMIQQQADKLNYQNVKVYSQKYEKVVPKLCEEIFHIVFLDPPYALWNDSFAETLLKMTAPLIKDEGVLVVRIPKKSLHNEVFIPGFRCYKVTEYSEAEVCYFRSEK